MLIGAYLTAEYSLESAALFNPSIVPHHNQRNIPAGAVRIIMSLRATGEGHVSSIVFRTGVIYSDHQIQIDPCSRFTRPVRVVPDKQFEKPLFRRKLQDIGVNDAVTDLVLDRLGDFFTAAQLEQAITEVRAAAPETLHLEESLQEIGWLAHSNYQLELPREAEASELVIFPQTINESHGIEDLRMVRFVEDDGTVTYYGTYTAFDGYHVLPQLIETRDFLRIGVHTINGACAWNKGMALFPRRIGGHYAMCSRIDGENLYIMYSDIVHFWETAELLRTPQYPWGLVQIGNCGSPLETPEGWLLLTHGVGPMRTYCIGAMLLDLNDPVEGDRLPRRAADRAHRKGTRRLRAQRRLLLRGDDPQRGSLPPLRHVRHDHPLCHRVARIPAEPAHRLDAADRFSTPKNARRDGARATQPLGGPTAYLKCGDLHQGFARVRCPDCHHDHEYMVPGSWPFPASSAVRALPAIRSGRCSLPSMWPRTFVFPSPTGRSC